MRYGHFDNEPTKSRFTLVGKTLDKLRFAPRNKKKLPEKPDDIYPLCGLCPDTEDQLPARVNGSFWEEGRVIEEVLDNGQTRLRAVCSACAENPAFNAIFARPLRSDRKKARQP